MQVIKETSCMCEQLIPGYFSSPTWPGTRLIQSISTQVVKFSIHSTLLSISSRVAGIKYCIAHGLLLTALQLAQACPPTMKPLLNDFYSWTSASVPALLCFPVPPKIVSKEPYLTSRGFL